MYNAYCASCHGKDATGNSPAAPALKTPANLTTLAKANNGKFPSDHVAMLLRNGPSDAGSYGSADMPVWGPLFSSVSSHSSGVVTLRISNVVRYLESKQVK